MNLRGPSGLSALLRSPLETLKGITPPHFILNLLFGLGVFLFFVGNVGELRAQPRLTKAGWNMVFADQFTTDPASNPSVWSTEFGFGNFMGGNTFLPSNVVRTYVAGQNDVNLKSKPNSTITMNGQVANVFNSGLLRTRYDDYVNGGGTYPAFGYTTDPHGPSGWLYGMFEVRCKLPKHRGTTPCIWMAGSNTWPPELDVFETSHSFENDPNDPVNSPGNFSKIFTSTVWRTSPTTTDLCSSYTNFPYNLTDEFHTWTLVWTPYEVAYFLDSVEIKTLKDPIHVPGFHTRLTQYPMPTLLNEMQELIINNATAAKELPQDNTLWALYNSMGITDLSDLIVDKVEIYRPAGLSEPISQYPYFKPLPYPVSSFGNFVTNTLLPAYSNTPFRTTDSWASEYVGWDLKEYPTGDYTNDYNIVGNPVVTKGADEGFFFVNSLGGNNKLSYGRKTPSAANPNKYTIVDIDINVPTGNNITGGRIGTSAPLTIFYRNGSQLMLGQSTNNGASWTTSVVTGCNDVAGAMSFDDTNGDLIYKATGNKLVLVTRASNGAYTQILNLTNAAKLYNATNTNAPSDVGDNLVFDPMYNPSNLNELYYRSSDGLKIVKLYKPAATWLYRATTISGGVAMMKSTLKGDNTWRRIIYTKTTGNGMFHFNPTTFVSTAVTFGTAPNNSGTLVNVMDFATGNSHNSTTISANPKNIYYRWGFDNKFYMLVWNATTGVYNSSEVKILGDADASSTLGNMQPTNKDMPTFHRTNDGRLRKLSYGPQSPIDNLTCNACWVPSNCLWNHAPVMPLQGNTSGNTDAQGETKPAHD